MLKQLTARPTVVASRTRRIWRRNLQGWLFASPFLVGFFGLVVYPMFYSIWLTTQSWDLLTPAKYVGLGNLRTLVRDPKIAKALGNTAYFTFLGVPIHLALALALALALNTRLAGRTLYRTIFYLPTVTPVVASAVIWLQIFHTDFGILNQFLGNFGIPPIKWLWEPAMAKPAFILMTCWTIGQPMVIFLASLQSVPTALYEAAEIDGATKWKQFLHVTTPMISPVIFFNLVMGIISSFQVFTASHIMTGGGPQDATLFMVLYVYRNGFQYFKMGYASVLAWMLCLIIVFFTVVQFKLGRRWVYYEGS